MRLQLEDIPYQQHAIDAAVSLCNWQYVQLADLLLLSGIHHANFCNSSDAQITANKRSILARKVFPEAETSQTLHPETVQQLLVEPQAFICLERVLETRDKWNL